MRSKKIFALSGSTRTQSSNLQLLYAIEKLSNGKLEFLIYDGLSALPQFNPDNQGEKLPDTVRHFREEIRAADGVLICTPEYAHGVPGSLKNAIDWTVSSGEFSQKPTVLITASTDGTFAHTALLETLRVIEAKNVVQLNLLIQFVQTKVNAQQQITDDKTKAALTTLLDNFYATLGENQ